MITNFPRRFFRPVFLLLGLLAAAMVPAASAQSVLGNAISFNGNNRQGVLVTNFGAIIPTNEVTVEFWAYTTKASNVQSAFILAPDTTINRFNGHINFGGPAPNIGLTYWDFGHTSTGRLGGIAAPTNSISNWVHYAFVASQSSNSMSIYTNGVLQSAKTGMAVFARGSYDLQIGGISSPYSGLLDDFRIWSVARSAAQIQAGFNAPLTGAEAGLLLYYRFDSTAGTVATNSAVATGPAYDGKLTNGPAWAGLPVLTNLPVGMTNTVAKLGGLVVPNAGATVWFEWGLSPFSYGATTAPVNLGSSGTSVNVSNLLSGLTPGLTYHSRLVASNVYGVVRGKDVPFGAPAIVINNPAVLTNECHAAFSDPFATNPVTVTGAPLAVAAGGSHSLALRSDGTVAAWGNNTAGAANVPTGLSNVVAVAGGGAHSLALKGDGTVVAWGNNASFQTNVPAGLSNAVAIAAGDLFSLALKSDGLVVGWGKNTSFQTNIPAGLSNVVAIAAGDVHGLALKSDGTVVAWGDNAYGQTNIPVGLSNVVAIAAGNYHNLALKSNGTVTAWGAGTTSTGVPQSGQSIIPAGLSNAVAIAAGGYHSLAVKRDGTVAAWGYGLMGQTNVPVGLSNAVAIAAGDAHSLALTEAGTILAWGLDGDGQATVPGSVTNLALTVTVGGTFSTNNAPGSYLLGYFVTNSLGGSATVGRTVVIQDTVRPTLTVLGPNPLTNSLNVAFIDPGAAGLDACAGSLVVTSNSPVNIGVPGAYTVTYYTADNYANAATNTRTVVVVAPATLWTVTTTNDAGAGSLRQAVASAVPGDIVRFTNTLSGQSITLTSGEITLNKTLTVDASALPGGLQLNGNASSRIFNLTAGSVLLSGLTITNGRSASGATGGGINNTAILLMDRCAVVGNVASNAGGGGICVVGSASRLFLQNCTVAGNQASFGGGILSRSTNTMSLVHTTVFTNLASGGTGGLVLETGSTGILENTILAGNQHVGSSSDADLGGSGAILKLAGNNIIGVSGSYASLTPVGAPNTNGQYVGTSASPLNPLLAPLGLFGGTTPIAPPLPGSPAINACVKGTSQLLDQRGSPRVIGAWADIGAAEGVFSPNLSLVTSNGARLSFQFPFTNLNGVSFSVLVSTNPATPLNAWLNLGAALETPSGSGQFQFSDPQATNTPHRFYMIKAP